LKLFCKLGLAWLFLARFGLACGFSPKPAHHYQQGLDQVHHKK
jgi:hypothetical protein